VLDGEAGALYTVYVKYTHHTHERRRSRLLAISLNVASAEPFYRQIVDQIRTLILSGRLEPGTALPSVRSLAQQLTVSVITTRRAYEELERDGWIYTRPRMGSFVADAGGGRIKQARVQHIQALFTEAWQEARRVGLSAAEIRELVAEVMAQAESADHSTNDQGAK
jgi:GntR family transcriptional regulator